MRHTLFHSGLRPGTAARLRAVAAGRLLVLALAPGLVGGGVGSSPAVAQAVAQSAGSPGAGAPAGSNTSGRVGDAGLLPHEGEIRVEGRVLAVDAARGTLRLGVTTFSLPSGSSRRMEAPRPKAIVVSDLTLLHVRGNAARLVGLGQLKDEVYAVAIGPDTGSGRPLLARRVAVWNRVEAGAFRFDGATAPAQPSAGALEAAAPEAAPAQPPAQPPVQPVAAEYNELADGGFENLARGLPGGWTFGARAREERDEEGNHFAVISIEGAVAEADRKIKTYLKANPAWKTLRVSARMRLRNTPPGQKQQAHLGVVYYGEKDEFLGLGPTLALAKDSDWVTLSDTLAVPEGTRKVMIDVGVYGPSGELSVDDVRVEASPRLV